MSEDSTNTDALRKPSGWTIFFRLASIASLVLISVFMISAFIALLYLHRGLPSLDTLQNYRPKEVSVVYSQHGEVIGEFFEERRYVERDIPLQIKNAFIAAEDGAFYYHQGVDFFGMLRAAYKNLVSGGIRQGASTITQQVARSFLLSSERTYERKIREIILAWQIENTLSKDEILFLYLTHTFLGAGAYGVASAAQTYFGKNLKDLSLAEAAILAGLPQAPSRYSPRRNPERVKRRQLYVLKQMKERGFITQQEFEDAANEDIFIEPAVDLNREKAPYFVEYVRQQVMEKYGSEKVLTEGLKIHTTVDMDQTRAGENALRKGLSDLEKRQGYRGPLRHTTRDDYFSNRELRDEDDRERETTLEVAKEEITGRGRIRMRQSRGVNVGDVLEGIVVGVSNELGEARVEYESGGFAKLKLSDMLWAHRRREAEDDSPLLQIDRVSEILKVGDVILISVSALPEADGQPVLAQLEQQSEVEGAVLSMQPTNGFVTAMIGGYDFNRSQFNRALQAKRQPGSAFKPIIYAAALDFGFTPSTSLPDTPITFENDIDKEKWRPANYDNRFLGEVTLRNALLTSRNIPTIRLLNDLGIDKIIQYAKRLGIQSPLDRDFTLALGSSVVNVLEMMQPYVVFATGGYQAEPIFITQIFDRDNNILETAIDQNFSAGYPEMIQSGVDFIKRDLARTTFGQMPEPVSKDSQVSFLQDVNVKQDRTLVSSPLRPGQVLSSEASYLMTHLLKENILYGSGRRARELQRPASGKTGTTDQNRDAWFIGFTPDLVAAVWVGYDDLRVLGRDETGSRAAVPIWLDFMAKAVAPYPASDFEIPDTIEFVRINPRTGFLASAQDKAAISEAFMRGTTPKEKPTHDMKDSDFYLMDR